jgi:DnaJ family protein B protein 4
MSGMDGMGGTRSRGASLFDDGEDMGPFGSSSGMPGGMPGSRPSTGRHSPRRSSHSSQPSEVLKPLPISLEDLYQGTTKRMKVSRKTVTGETEDKVSSQHLS